MPGRSFELNLPIVNNSRKAAKTRSPTGKWTASGCNLPRNFHNQNTSPLPDCAVAPNTGKVAKIKISRRKGNI
jgi:hypothetical protein